MAKNAIKFIKFAAFSSTAKNRDFSGAKLFRFIDQRENLQRTLLPQLDRNVFLGNF